MKVLLARADNGGCAFYRMQEPARVVSEQFDVEIRVDQNVNVEGTRDKTGLTDVHEVAEDIDLLVVQRPLNQHMLPLVQQAKRQGIATIVELDDDLERVERGNRAWAHVQPQNNRLENYDWLKKTAAEADLVTVSTSALGRFNPRSHVILPNCVPESIFEIERVTELDQTAVGWTGSIQTHPGDLESARGRIAQAVHESGAQFRVVGDGVNVQNALGLSKSTPFYATGWTALSEYYQSIKDNIDVGVVPLASNAFNQAKSRLKGLEFAALGIPFIASDVSDYQRLTAAGVGKLARRPTDFEKFVGGWVVSDATREKLGVEYKERVRESMTYEVNAHRWLDAWQKAIDIRKASK